MFCMEYFTPELLAYRGPPFFCRMKCSTGDFILLFVPPLGGGMEISMPKLTLKSIKRENARLVLEAIARKKHITKLEIAEETGLSLVTAGNLVSMLGTGGIIMRAKIISKRIGRHPEVFRIRYDWLIPVFEISSRTFRFYITDLEGRVLDKVEYRCTDGPEYTADAFINFLKRTLELLKKEYKHKKALGVGVSIAGVYDAENDVIRSSMLPELSSVKLMQNISKIFKQKNIVIDNANRLCAAGIIERIQGYRDMCISCLYVGDSIECTTCDHGVYIRGGNFAGRLGDLPYAPGFTYANFLRDAQSTADVTEPVLALLKTVSAAYDPDIIYLCSDKFQFTPVDTNRISSALQNGMRWPHRVPEIVFVHSVELEGMSGIISRIIDNWLDTLIE